MRAFIYSRKSVFAFCACICLLLSSMQSCKNDEGQVPTLEVAINAIPNVGVAGATKSFYIVSNTQWTITSDKGWCTVNPPTGTGNASVNVIIEPTSLATTRTACITVTAANTTPAIITVTQVGTVLGVSTSAITNIAPAGTTTSFDLTANTNWTISSDRTWCRVAPASGSGSSTISVIVDPTGEATERTAILTIEADGGHADYVTVTQNRAVVELSPSTYYMPTAGGTTTFALTTSSSWTATSNAAAWCHVSPALGTGNGVLTVTVDANTFPAARSATITVSAGVLSGYITINQETGYTRVTDSLALVDIYNAVGMENSTTGKWILTTPLPVSGTSTNWPGVRINAQGRVDSIVVALNVIPTSVTNAYLPESIGDLKELRWLAWSGNATSRLTGSIPNGIGKLTKLIRLTLTAHAFTGAIPGSIGNLTEMINISFLNSTIDGAVPASIGNLTKLTDLNLNSTNITSLPVEMGNCVSLINLMCTGTKITSLPDMFANFTNIGLIQMNGNTLCTGPLPPSIGLINTSRATLTIYLYGCAFTGSIPAAWATITTKCGANNLRIQDNKLSGEIPAAVKAHANWATWFNSGTPANVGTYICPQQAGFGFTNCSL